GHAHVEEHEGHRRAADGLERLLAVSRGHDLVALAVQQIRHGLENRAVVIDDQDRTRLPRRELTARTRGGALGPGTLPRICRQRWVHDHHPPGLFNSSRLRSRATRRGMYFP